MRRRPEEGTRGQGMIQRSPATRHPQAQLQLLHLPHGVTFTLPQTVRAQPPYLHCNCVSDSSPHLLHHGHVVLSLSLCLSVSLSIPNPQDSGSSPRAQDSGSSLDATSHPSSLYQCGLLSLLPASSVRAPRTSPASSNTSAASVATKPPRASIGRPSPCCRHHCLDPDRLVRPRCAVQDLRLSQVRLHQGASKHALAHHGRLPFYERYCFCPPVRRRLPPCRPATDVPLGMDSQRRLY